MSTPVKPTIQAPSVPPHRMDASFASPVDAADRVWRPLYAVGATLAALAVAFVVLGVVVFLIWPPPTTTENWFALFQRNGFIGLLDSDLLLVMTYVVLIPLYLALYVALRHASASFMAIALAFNLAGAALIVTVNPGAAMFALSGHYAAATTDAQRIAFLAAGQALTANWSGTSFVVGYLLGGIATLITAAVMLRSKVFSRATAYTGLVMGALMLVPASAGIVGLIASLLSLVPTAIFFILLARRFFEMSGMSDLFGNRYVIAHPA